MLIFNSWQSFSVSHIYIVEEDGSELRCLSRDFGLVRPQRLSVSPGRDRLSFMAGLPHQGDHRFFLWEFSAGKLLIYRQ
jgi:hypothetical protein